MKRNAKAKTKVHDVMISVFFFALDLDKDHQQLMAKIASSRLLVVLAKLSYWTRFRTSIATIIRQGYYCW